MSKDIVTITEFFKSYTLPNKLLVKIALNHNVKRIDKETFNVLIKKENLDGPFQERKKAKIFNEISFSDTSIIDSVDYKPSLTIDTETFEENESHNSILQSNDCSIEIIESDVEYIINSSVPPEILDL